MGEYTKIIQETKNKMERLLSLENLKMNNNSVPSNTNTSTCSGTKTEPATSGVTLHRDIVNTVFTCEEPIIPLPLFALSKLTQLCKHVHYLTLYKNQLHLVSSDTTVVAHILEYQLNWLQEEMSRIQTQLLSTCIGIENDIKTLQINQDNYLKYYTSLVNNLYKKCLHTNEAGILQIIKHGKLSSQLVEESSDHSSNNNSYGSLVSINRSTIHTQTPISDRSSSSSFLSGSDDDDECDSDDDESDDDESSSHRSSGCVHSMDPVTEKICVNIHEQQKEVVSNVSFQTKEISMQSWPSITKDLTKLFLGHTAVSPSQMEFPTKTSSCL